MPYRIWHKQTSSYRLRVKVILEYVPKTVKRILDLGTGDGRLLALLKIDRPQAESIAIDFSPTMLEAAKQSFAAGDEKVKSLTIIWIIPYRCWVLIL